MERREERIALVFETREEKNARIPTRGTEIVKFIAALKREQGLVEVRQAKFIAGAPPAKRRRAQASEQAVVNLVAGYHHRPGLEFLRGVAHHFSLGAD